MNWGMIKAVACCWVGPMQVPCLRILVLQGNHDFCYLYIPGTNYKFSDDDLVSWNHEAFYWHSDDRNSMKFPLVGMGQLKIV